MKRALLKNFALSVAAVLTMLLVWVVAYFVVRNDYVLPSLSETCREMGRLFSEADFWMAFSNTLLRTAVAFLVALVLGIALALIANLWTWVRAFLSPIVSVLRTVPTMAVILMLLLWTTPRVAPVIVSLLVLMPAVYAATLSSLNEVTAEYGVLAQAFRIPAWKRAWKMYLPLVAPPVFGQAGSIFSMGLKITVSGEVLSNTFQSLGGMMQEAKMFVMMPRLMALTLITVVVGFLLEAVCLLIYKLIVRWRG